MPDHHTLLELVKISEALHDGGSTARVGRFDPDSARLGFDQPPGDREAESDTRGSAGIDRVAAGHGFHTAPLAAVESMLRPIA
jgi:hypothetical protein